MPKVEKARKWYAVRIGRQPGVYDTWEEAERQVSRLRKILHSVEVAQINGFPGAIHRWFPNYHAATVSGDRAMTGTSSS